VVTHQYRPKFNNRINFYIIHVAKLIPRMQGANLCSRMEDQLLQMGFLEAGKMVKLVDKREQNELLAAGDRRSTCVVATENK
jgi:hypothetical protein